MNRKMIALAGILALMTLPAVYASAQAPEPPEGAPEEHEGWQKEMPPEMDGDMNVQKEVIIRKQGRQGERFGDEGMMQNRKFGGREGMQGKKFGGGEEGLMDEDKVISTIKKYDPKFAGTVYELRETAPAEYKLVVNISRKLFEAARREGDEKLEKDAVRAVALEYDTKKLSRKYERASDADKAAIKADLKVKLAELFDLRQVAQQVRVQRMEKELAKLKKDMETRKANKDKIVQERVAQLTGEGFGW